MPAKDLLPFVQEKRGRKKAQAITAADTKSIPKLFKAISLAVGFTGGTYSLGFNRINFEPAPYDFNRIIQAIDTDSYVKQAFAKHQELLWKEGFAITGENTDAVNYLNKRIAFMELSMKRPIQDFFMEVTDQLNKFSNAFIVKVRGDLQPYFPDRLIPANEKQPIVGYQVVPAETMEIMRDYHNKVLKYRQNVWGSYGYSAAAAGFGKDQRDYANLLPTWNPEEVIHLYVDRKPGRIFGTPFMVSVMDDVISLRQMEEDILNLVHQELFPLYKYHVGTEDHPAEPEEVENAAREVGNIRAEGGIVLPDRHDVEVIGSEGSALKIDLYLNHWKERVAVGMGLSQHHLGMTANGGNRSVTDNLDTALYDKVKLKQAYISHSFQLQMFNELLLEGGYDPYIPETNDEDECKFQFNEIDIDTQIKKENHIIQKWTSDMLEEKEMRLAIKQKPEFNEDQTYTAFSNRMIAGPGRPIKPEGGGTPGQTNLTPKKGGAAPNPLNPAAGKSPQQTQGGANNTPNKPDAGKNSQPGKLNTPNKTNKGVANKARPSNQFGRSLSPNVKHSNDEWLMNVVELLDDELN